MDRFASAHREDPFSLSAKDQALLDSLVEATLAELRAHRPIPVETSEEEIDPKKRFFSSAVAFLAGRPDRGELIELLREAVVAAPPPGSVAKQPSNQPPEAGDVR